MKHELGFWSAAEVAEGLELDLTPKAATQYTRRFLRRFGLARQDTPRGEVYVSQSDLQTKFPSVYEKVIRGRQRASRSFGKALTERHELQK